MLIITNSLIIGKEHRRERKQEIMFSFTQRLKLHRYKILTLPLIMTHHSSERSDFCFSRSLHFFPSKWKPSVLPVYKVGKPLDSPFFDLSLKSMLHLRAVWACHQISSTLFFWSLNAFDLSTSLVFALVTLLVHHIIFLFTPISGRFRKHRPNRGILRRCLFILLTIFVYLCLFWQRLFDDKLVSDLLSICL